MPLAHWLAATVHVARQVFDEAERELTIGIDAMRATRDDDSVKFPGVALEWLAGLIRLLRGDEAGALDHFARELAHGEHEHLYAREACASAWYAIGAVHFRHSRQHEAAQAFRRALDRVARHPAAAALDALGVTAGLPEAREAASDVSGEERDDLRAGPPWTWRWPERCTR